MKTIASFHSSLMPGVRVLLATSVNGEEKALDRSLLDATRVVGSEVGRHGPQPSVEGVADEPTAVAGQGVRLGVAVGRVWSVFTARGRSTRDW
ncbi:hypothetical protein JOE26_003618 [Rhodococcus coprophilus]|uniref:Uncharacterized protein n=1 Tax=Rhodococcus coprophilus TaxID=38310 RepID=A0A2X4TMG5_9NOCA|nr:hypothetical protein [Rhodococcus coprophilus]SQI28747.1 Uncharacterised protein [Rhodococcus coprophilus]